MKMNIIRCRLRIAHTGKKTNEWFCHRDPTENKESGPGLGTQQENITEVIAEEVHDRARRENKNIRGEVEVQTLSVTELKKTRKQHN